MKPDFDKAWSTAEKVADEAVKTTRELVKKGQNKVEEYQLQRRLAKAQRRLGVLAYTLYKAGKENDALVARYVEDIDLILQELEALKAAAAAAAAATEAPADSGVEEDAMFCGGSVEDKPAPEGDVPAGK